MDRQPGTADESHARDAGAGPGGPERNLRRDEEGTRRCIQKPMSPIGGKAFLALPPSRKDAVETDSRWGMKLPFVPGSHVLNGVLLIPIQEKNPATQ